MGTIYHAAQLDVPAEVAWEFLDRYTRAELHVFSICSAERKEGDFRVVTLTDGSEIWERNVSVDPSLMRAVYAIPGVYNAEHHQAEMRVLKSDDGQATLVWITDYLPHELADNLRDLYAKLFQELVAGINNYTPLTATPSPR